MKQKSSKTKAATLPPAARIKKRSDFLKIQNSAKKLQNKCFLLLIEDSKLSTARIGIVVSKRVDKRAVARNKIKRIVREVFRRLRSRLTKPFDIVVIARQNALQCGFKEADLLITKSLEKGGFLCQAEDSD